MKLLKWILIIMVICCAFTHRRVIKSVLTGSPMPKAPKWHFWVAEDKRRS